ncbi:MAG: V-type ATP synthase subunit A, partial [Treponema sp.]|nr:V-type ATP synthase subunit A [Treponema sp.]
LANARHYPAISWIDSYSEYAGEVKPWWERVNPQWEVVRQKSLDLLKREQRLAEIVRLIGPDALPDDQRLILLTADLIKDGFLRQNSFDEVDMYCVPAKQVRLLELMMEFYERAQTCIRLGAPLTKISSLKGKKEPGGEDDRTPTIRERLSRLKSEVKNDDLPGLEDFAAGMRGSLEELERSYRSREVL